MPRCDDCRFWVGSRENESGECHRYPPRQTDQRAPPSDWCGEFQRALDADIAARKKPVKKKAKPKPRKGK